MDAWSEVYWLMANALIKIERGLYASQANNVTHAPFKVVDRQETGDNVVVLTFEPADETPMTEAKAGQYISIITKARDGLRQPANTPCFRPIKNQRRIGVKLDPNGEMTSINSRAQDWRMSSRFSNPYW